MIPSESHFFLGFFIYAIFSYLDLVTMPESKYFAIVVRLIGCSSIIVGFLVTFLPIYSKIYMYFNSILLVIVGGSIVMMFGFSNQGELAYITYYSGVGHILLCIFFYGGLRFVRALSAGIILLLVYNFVAIFIHGFLETVDGRLFLTNNNFFLVGTIILSSIAANFIERAERNDFLTRYVISEKFVDLVHYYEQTNPSPAEIF